MTTRSASLRSGPRGLVTIALGLLVALVACSRRAPPDAEPTQPTYAPGIYRVESGERLTTSEFADRLESAHFVVFGEQHTSEWQHQRQAALYRRLTRSADRRFALGMEMFQRPFQSALNRYVAGDIDESTTLERTEWEERWGVDPSLYRPLWKTAKSRDVPIVALNLRREISKKIARVGLAGLEERERRRLPDQIDTSIRAQREYVRRAFERHDMSQHMEFEHFLEAQAAWDETMAKTAVDAVSEGDDIDRMFIVAGRAHARSDFGIPRRLERLASEKNVVSILPFSISEIGSSTLEQSVHADYAWLGRPPGDRANLTGTSPGSMVASALQFSPSPLPE